jgi:hypothetical protein
MGLYATTTSLDTVMVGVNFDTATTALASKKIDQAEQEVNRALSERFDLSSSYFQTTTSIPPMVRSLTEQLAEGFTWIAIARGSKETQKRGQDMVESARLGLKAIHDFEANLLDSAGSAIPDQSDTSYQIRCNTSSYVPTMNEDTVTAWRVDPTKLDDIADSRD